MSRFPSVDGTAGFWKRVSGNRLYPGPNGGFTFFSGCPPGALWFPRSSSGGGQVVVEVSHMIGADKCLHRMEQT